MEINEILKLGLPILAMLVSYALQKVHLSNTANTIIATVTVIAATVLSLFLQGKLTGNVYADTMLVASASVALQAESFAPLQQYLRSSLFPSQKVAKNVSTESSKEETPKSA